MTAPDLFRHPRLPGLPAVLALLLLALASFATGPAHSQPPGTAMPTILDARSAHAKAMAREIVLVDIRTPMEWRETGLPASAHAISMDQKPEALVAALTQAVGGDMSRPLALICRTGNRSAFLASQLRRIGFTNVIDVSEGMAGSRAGIGWARTGLPVRAGAEAAQPPKLDAPAAGAKP